MRTSTDEQQRAFAHGWPHLRVLGRAKSSKSPAQRAADVLGRVDPPASVAWTREVALAYLRDRARAQARSLGATFGSALTDADSLAFLLGFPLLRASPDRRERVRELAASYPAASTVGQLLALVVGGGAAARELRIDQLAAAQFVDDDPELLAELAATEYRFASFSPRFVWLGGAPLLDHFVERARKPLPTWYTRRFVEEFGVFAEPGAVTLMATLAEKKPCRPAALKWFSAHAELADQHRERVRDSAVADELLAVIDATR